MVSIHDIVTTVLEADGDNFVTEKVRISTMLNVPSHDSEQWMSSFRNQTINSYELLTLIIKSWVERNGDEANIKSLGAIFSINMFQAAAEALASLPDSKIRQALPNPTTTHPRQICFGLKKAIHKFIGREKPMKTVAVILGVVRPDGIHLHILQNLVDIYLRNKPGPPRSKMLRLFSCQLFCKTEDGAVPTLTQATPPRTRKVVQLLTKFSLVNVESEVISIHRLVQDIFRLECDYKDALSILLKHVKIKGLSREELVQLISIWEHADEEIVKQNSNLVFQIFDKMFWSTPDLMMHEKEGFLNKNYALLRQVCGPDHAETIKMEVFVSLVSNHDCDPAETLTKYTQLFDKIQMVFGSRHPLTNLTICCIAQTLLSLGRPEEALEWCRKRLAQDHLLCVQEEHKMHTMSIMAKALVHLTRFDEAIIIYQEILEWRIKNLGPSHEHTLATLNHLTIFPYVAGRITEEDAITEFENQLGQMVDKLGPEHRITLNTKYTLAGALWDMGDTDKAFVMLEEVLLSMEKAFGPNHRDTVLVRKGISERKIMMEEGTTRKCLYPGVKW